MVLEYYGIRVDPVRLWRVLGMTDIGTPPTRLPQLASLGFFVRYAFALDERQIVEALESGVPPICLVSTGALSHWNDDVQHAIVVVAKDENGFLVNDPAFAESRHWVSFDAFMLAWSDMDYQYAIIRPR